MRGLALLVAAGVLVGGCVAPKAHPAKAERKEKISYNRREMPPEQGLFSGPDGSFSIYRNDAERRRSEPPAPPAPPKPTTLSCEPGFVCDPPADPR